MSVSSRRGRFLYAVVSAVIVVLAILLGGRIGILAFERGGELSGPWTSLGPPDVDVVDMRVYVRPDHAHIALLVRTGDARLLSTGTIQDRVAEVRWQDISGGHSWSDFPELASGWRQNMDYELFIRHEGDFYQVDARGQWQRVEVSESDFPWQQLGGADIPQSKDALPAGEVTRFVAVRLGGVESPTVCRFALVRGNGVLVSESRMMGGLTNGLGSALAGATGGLLVGMVLARALQRMFEHSKAEATGSSRST